MAKSEINPRAMPNINKLNEWYEDVKDDKRKLRDYIDFNNAKLNKARISRDYDIGYKALASNPETTGSAPLQERFDIIDGLLREKHSDTYGTIEKTSPENDSEEGTPLSLDAQKLERELVRARKTIVNLEKKLAAANAKLVDKESEFSSLSELRKTMGELGFFPSE